MIKITNEIDGKLYELVTEEDLHMPCNGCAFNTNDGDDHCHLKDDSFHGFCLCYKLRGIWKEVKDEKQYEYGVESFYNGHWIIEQTGFDELCEAKNYIDIFKCLHPEDKAIPVRRKIGKWEVVENEKTN